MEKESEPSCHTDRHGIQNKPVQSGHLARGSRAFSSTSNRAQQCEWGHQNLGSESRYFWWRYVISSSQLRSIRLFQMTFSLDVIKTREQGWETPTQRLNIFPPNTLFATSSPISYSLTSHSGHLTGNTLTSAVALPSSLGSSLLLICPVRHERQYSWREGQGSGRPKGRREEDVAVREAEKGR